jgi:phosphatidylserine/phosphatidylglycerophosphate/cardiolipin synthase-like enzyme
MRPNPLTSKYVFRDTDMLIQLRATTHALTASFDRLWQFDLMVATLADVRAHAPNDYLVALRAANDACSASESGKKATSNCRDRELAKTQKHTLGERIAEQRRKMLANYRRFNTRYSPTPLADRSPSFLVGSSATIHYLENVPLHRAPRAPERTRGYGAENGLEGDSGKHIHAIWLHALRDVCTRATAQRPQHVIVHNAYFFPPSNLWQRMARMVDGREDCGDVKITVLTNSVETTDLNVVNIAARHSLKAFAEFAAQRRHPDRGATFAYHEYRPPEADSGGSKISLHSKVLVIGPYVFVGSANADVRSYMMDTNNGLLISNAPGLVRAYSLWVQSLLDDSTLTREITDEFRDTPRAQMLEQDRQTLRAIFGKYRADRWIKEPGQKQALEETIVRILDEIYRLTKGSLGDGAGADKAAAQFNDRFKTI